MGGYWETLLRPSRYRSSCSFARVLTGSLKIEKGGRHIYTLPSLSRAEWVLADLGTKMLSLAIIVAVEILMWLNIFILDEWFVQTCMNWNAIIEDNYCSCNTHVTSLVLMHIFVNAGVDHLPIFQFLNLIYLPCTDLQFTDKIRFRFCAFHLLALCHLRLVSLSPWIERWVTHL